MSGKYDVVIVGARCAGAALATHLARASVRTLLLDAAELPSDHVLSTHFVHPPGVDSLDGLGFGVGAKVRAAAPPSRTAQFRCDDAAVLGDYPDGRAAFCVRRSKLDAWLQDAAIAAGAELRDRSRVVELVSEGGRVSGVVVESPSGRETLRAGLVVGADGVHSTVAKLTGVEEYLASDMTRGAYWSYWPAPAAWKNDERFRYDTLFAFEGDGLRYVFQTDDDLLLLLAAPPNAEARSWGRDHRERHIDYFRRSKLTAPLVENNAPVGKVIGIVSSRFFYRRATGPGFALVGDAGNYKDWVTGHGITDALLGAERLARAILDGRDAAFTHYWRERDALTLPLYFDAQRIGEVGANDPFARLLFRKMGASSELSSRLGAVADRRMSPFDAIPPAMLARWVGGAVLRGQLDIVAPFLRVGKKMAAFQKEVAHRQKLFVEAAAALASPRTA